MELKETKDKFRDKALKTDKIARLFISSGGYGVIISITFILAFLVYKSWPLFQKASVEEGTLSPIPAYSEIKITGADNFNEVGYTLNEKGIVEFYNLADGNLLNKDTLLGSGEKIVRAVKGSFTEEIVAFFTDSSAIYTVKFEMKPMYKAGERRIVNKVEIKDSFYTEGGGIKNLAFVKDEDGVLHYVWITENNRIFIGVNNPDSETEVVKDITDLAGNEVFTSAIMDKTGEKLITGTSKGEMFWIDIEDAEKAYLRDNWKAGNGAITQMKFLIGDNSIIASHQSGRISQWFAVREKDSEFKFRHVRDFDSEAPQVKDISVSPRNRAFIATDVKGISTLYYAVSGSSPVRINNDSNLISVAYFSPKADRIIVSDLKGRRGYYNYTDPHPEINSGTLFGEVWYEGYPEPDYVWQSTGGSDDFEPKLSLIPLIFGTLKGTFYSLLFSVPLALLAAIYISQFAPSRFARIVKPAIEIMAALPSVVIGFLAGLYFSPLFEKNLMMLILLLGAIVVFFLLSVVSWRLIPANKRAALPQGSEIVFVMPFMVLAFVAAIYSAGFFESALFGGNINRWLYEAMDINYDQRNSIVVGFAMGFAVIPIIFTISEDSLSNVPKSLTSASLALGASRWQTVRRVVLPAALGGIFAAVMLGLGRAIGETMIVLMATGNTPIMDMSPFNGFRAMSANIAVEIPEAPVDGTLYRVLFLTALMLFIFTFMINSIAAYIGDKLRKKYARY